jgi:hypothetical protein
LTPTHAVLREYADDAWRGTIVEGAVVAEIERWVARLEAKPLLAGGPVSGKPLAWLYLAVAAEGDDMQALRAIGLLPDIHRALDRSLDAADFEALRALFDLHGRPFHGRIQQPVKRR